MKRNIIFTIVFILCSILLQAKNIKVNNLGIEIEKEYVVVNEIKISKELWSNIIRDNPEINQIINSNKAYPQSIEIKILRLLEFYGIPIEANSNYQERRSTTAPRANRDISEEWINTLSSNLGGNEIIYSIGRDSLGNVYAFGQFDGKFEIGNNIYTSEYDTPDLFIFKVNNENEFQWSVHLISEEYPRIGDLATLSSGELFLTGAVQEDGSLTLGTYSITEQNMYIMKLNTDGSLLWCNETPTNGPDDRRFKRIITDNDGNAYLTGFFSGDMWLDNIHLYASGQNDIIVAKINNSGSYLWANRYGNSYQYNVECGNDLALDSSGNLYAAASGNSSSYRNGYLLKYSNDGNLIFSQSVGDAKRIGISDSDEIYYYEITSGNYNTNTHPVLNKCTNNGNSIWSYPLDNNVYLGDGGIVCNDNSIYWSASFYGETSSFTLGNETITPMQGITNSFVTKFDTNGNFDWVKQNKFDAKDIICDNQNYLFVGGAFSVSQNLDSIFLNNLGSNDGFYSKLNFDGDFISANSFGGGSDVKGQKIITDDEGYIYCAGTFEGEVNNLITLGSTDIFISKYSPQGDLIWIKQAGGYYRENVTGIDVDQNSNVYITGSFQGGETNFGTTILTSQTSPAVFVSKLDPDGNFIWAKNSDGTQVSGFLDYQIDPAGIAVDSIGTCFLTGIFRNNISFDSISLLSNTGNDWESNAYIVKFGSDGLADWGVVAAGGDYSGGNDISIGNENEIYLSGSFSGQNRSFGDFILSGADDYSNKPFYAKMDYFGDFTWVSTADLNISRFPVIIPIEYCDGNYLTAAGIFASWGPYDNTATFGDTVLYSTNGQNYITRIDSDGSFLSANQFDSNSPGNDWITDISEGMPDNIYCSTTEYDSYSRLSRILRYSIEEGIEEILTINFNSYGKISGICANARYELLATGDFSGTINIGNNTINASTGSDAFIIRYDFLEPRFVSDIRFGYESIDANFSDLSCGTDLSWYWDFQNDGIYDSFEQNPSNINFQSGIYDVKLMVTDGARVDSLVKESYIVVQQNQLLPPQNPTITISSNDAIINWNSVENADYYLVYNSTNPLDDFEFLNYTVADTTFTDNGVCDIENKRFYYIIGFDGTMEELTRFINQNKTKNFNDKIK